MQRNKRQTQHTRRPARSLPFSHQPSLSRSVTGTVRSPAKAAALTAAGIPCLALDLAGVSGLSPSAAAALASATALVATAPPVGDGEAAHDPFLASVLTRSSLICPALTTAIYVSSTSVYGTDRGGGWVIESDPPAPSNATGTARVAAEEAWRGWAADAGVSGFTFRAGGIYGPGRSALDVASSGTRSGSRRGGADASTPVSRVHVLDLARGILVAAGAEAGTAPSWTVVNAVDTDPAPRAEVVAAASALLKGEFAAAPAAPCLEPTTGKRVRGERFAALLEGKGGLVFPSYREGLTAIAGGDGRPFRG